MRIVPSKDHLVIVLKYVDALAQLNSFPARGGISRPFWVLRSKSPHKNGKILSVSDERWRVRKLKTSAFKNAIPRQIYNFRSKTTTLSNQAINLAALLSRLYQKNDRDTVYYKTVYVVVLFNRLLPVRFSSLVFYLKGTPSNRRYYVK